MSQEATFKQSRKVLILDGDGASRMYPRSLFLRLVRTDLQDLIGSAL